MVKDSISNLIIKIKNANRAGKSTVSAPYSKFGEAIVTLLEKEGFIKSFSKSGHIGSDKKVAKSIDIELLYNEDGTPKVEDVQRMSKLSKRLYTNAKDIKPVRNGYGLLVLSTPKGVLSDAEARKHNVGGELLFKIW